MRFVCIIMHKTTVLARVSVDDKANESPMRVSARARHALMRDANRHRSEMLSDGVLSQIADVYRDAVASQTISRKGRMITIKTSGETVHHYEGQVATLSGPDDLTALVEVYDDAGIAERESFLDEILTKSA